MFKAVKNSKSQKGFTLIEILFVIIIIAILAAVAIMRINTSRASAENSACAATQAIINTQVEQAMLDGIVYPANQAAFDAWLTNKTYFPDGVPACQGAAPACTYNAATFRASCTTGNP